MLMNENYKNTLDEAVEENSDLTFKDTENYFYKKWKRFMDYQDPNESYVEQGMKLIREEYRKEFERYNQTYPSAIPFNRFKPFIEESILFKIFREMPKGGLLHVHSAAALSLDGLLDLLKEWDGNTIYIACGEHNGRNLLQGTLFMQVPGIVMEGILPLKEFLGRSGAQTALREWLSLENPEKTERIPYIWDEFNRIFIRTSSLFSNKRFYYEYHKRFFKECIRDRIDYVELRCGFQEFDSKRNAEHELEVWGNTPRFLSVLKKAAAAAVKEIKAEGGRKGELRIRVILCARRDLDAWVLPDKEKLLKKIDAAIIWKQDPDYSQLIAGFDCVSEEDRGKNTYSYYKNIFYENALSGHEDTGQAEEIRARFHIAPRERIKFMNLMLHAGESLWMEQDNMVDVKVACRTRIGHGFQMVHFPGVVQSYLDVDGDSFSPGGPVLELCPISNQLLRYFPDLRAHSAYILAKMGVPFVLGNDDPQILGNPGLSYDFWEFYMASDGGMSLIKGLVFTAYMFRCADVLGQDIADFTEDDYGRCLDAFNETQWSVFLQAARRLLQ